MKLGNISVTKDDTGRSIAFFCKHSTVVVTKDLINAMINWSSNHTHVDIRLCLHQNKEDLYQEMIILQHKNRYHRPHKEIRAESYHIIRGVMMVVLFGSDGTVKDSTIVDSYAPLYRMGSSLWHVTIPLTPVVIFHEAKIGPYDREGLMFAPWAPTQQSEGRLYIKNLLEKSHST